ncbi:MAG TPA: NUDIX domain-containing protein [Candidatus Sulfotelmatobacter sp.]|nr:NUDIX domain-containing protein [Candidatus Sulfotelmatobacter sp.]
MDRDEDVELLEQETLFQGHYRLERFRLRHRLFAGRMGPPIAREIFRARDAVIVIPYDPEADKVVLIEEFRIGPYVSGEQPWPLSVIAGVIDPGETPEAVARREALEEAGCTLLGPLEQIVDFYTSPGCTSERIVAFCGRCRAAGIGGVHGLPDEGEDIRVRLLAFRRLRALLKQGQIRSGPALIAAQWLALNRARLRRQWLAEGVGRRA